MSINLTLLNFY